MGMKERLKGKGPYKKQREKRDQERSREKKGNLE